MRARAEVVATVAAAILAEVRATKCTLRELVQGLVRRGEIQPTLA